MDAQISGNRNEEKKVKFHHRVKRFYHKNLFRKIYTVAILGLVVANVVSILKYQSFAQESEWNTATLINNSDGSKTLTYNGKSYTIAGNDLPGQYYWGWNEPSYDNDGNPIEGKSDFDSYSTIGSSHNNDWGGGNDVYQYYNQQGDQLLFGYGAGDDNRAGRKGPCPEGWYVPSVMDWGNVMEGWCHLSSNDCESSNITYDTIIPAPILNDNGDIDLDSFYSDFNILKDNGYWSSTFGNGQFFGEDIAYRLWNLYISNSNRNDYSYVRCFKDLDYIPVEAQQNCTTLDGHEVTEGETIEAYMDNTPTSVYCDNYSHSYTFGDQTINNVYNKQKFVCREGNFYFSGNNVVRSDANLTYDGEYNNIYYSCSTGCETLIGSLDTSDINGKYYSKPGDQGLYYVYLSSGSSISVYPYDLYCYTPQKERWTCNNGAIEGNSRTDGNAFGYGGYASGCAYANNGACNENGERQGYSVGKVYGEYCPGQESYICEEGNWYENNNGTTGDSVDSVYSSCSDGCLLKDGTTFDINHYTTGYRNSTVPAGQACEPVQLYCSSPKSILINGSNVTDSNWYSECEVEQQLQNCTFRYDSQVIDIPVGDKTPVYVKHSNSKDFSNCGGTSQATCSSAGENLGYGYSSCTPQTCTFKGVNITGDNSSIKVYRNATVPYGTDGGCNFQINSNGETNEANLHCDNGKFKFYAEEEHTFDTEAEVIEYGYRFTSCSVENSTYTITWKDSDGGVLKTEELAAGVMPSYTPTKTGHRFLRWTPNVVVVSGDATYTAVWEEINSNTTPSYSGRGGRNSSSNKDSHNSADDKNTSVDKNETKTSEENKSQIITDNTDSQKSSDTESKGQKVPEIDMQRYNTMYTPEQNTAYQFAYHNKITTVPTIKEAKMNTPLTRIEMAKMLSQYAMNVLGQTPDHGAGVVNFKDVSSKLDAQYDNAVTLAYQLGIMGINMPNNEFRPNDKVTRAEFATALSRMIYEMEDGTGRLKYYEPHIARLYNEGIINVTNPKMLELRGNVMMMLMRTEK